MLGTEGNIHDITMQLAGLLLMTFKHCHVRHILVKNKMIGWGDGNSDSL
jgi:hypothetical protein